MLVQLQAATRRQLQRAPNFQKKKTKSEKAVTDIVKTFSSYFRIIRTDSHCTTSALERLIHDKANEFARGRPSQPIIQTWRDLAGAECAS